MKTTLGIKLKFTLACAVWTALTVSGALTASAATTNTWANTGTAFTTAGNWSSGAPTSGEVLLFNINTPTAYVNPAITVGENFPAGVELDFSGSASFGPPTGGFNFTLSAPVGINMESTAGPVLIMGWNLLTINGAGPQAIQNNSTVNTLTISNLNTGGSGFAILDGPGNILIKGTVSNNGQLATSNTFTGVATLFGSNTYNGPTTLSGGKFLVNGFLATNSVVTVNTNATLGGSGTINGKITVNAGGTLAPGAGGTISTLALSSNLSLAGTNTMLVNRDVSPSADKIVMTAGAVTLGGVLNIVNQGSAFQAGDSFTLINGTIASGSFYSSITPAIPGPSLVWDMSNLTNGGDGTLRVLSGTYQPPIAVNDTYNVRTNTAFTTNAPGVLFNDSDPGGLTLTAVTNSVPTHGSLTFNSNGSFTYTPNNGFIGTDSFTYHANDGIGSSSNATVTLNVVSDVAPVAANDSYTVNRNGIFTTNAPGVLGNDTDAFGNPLTAINFTLPSHGTLTSGSDGSFTYSPTNHYTGTDTFTYQAYDGQLTSMVATVTMNVVDRAPVAVNDSYAITNNVGLTVAATSGVLTNDTDADSDPLTVAVVANPAHGSLTLNSDGSFTYTANGTFSGTDSFTYQANDGVNNSGTATVTLTNPPVTWRGTANGSWANAANWSGTTLPANDNVFYDSTSTANFSETLDQGWNTLSLNILNPSGAITILNNGFVLTNGAINMASATQNLTILADYVSTGTATIAAGRTLTLSNIVGGNLNGATGPGTLRLIGTANPGQIVDTTGSLTLLVDGGFISSNPPVRLNAESGGTVKLIVTNNGTVQITGNGVKLHVGFNTNSGTPGTNIVNMESGLIAVGPSGTTGPSGIYVPDGANCVGILNLDGGVVALTNKYTTDTTNLGESLLQIPFNGGGFGTVNLNGGTLIVPGITGSNITTGSGTLNFNGTVVTANRTNSTWITNIQNAFVQSGGAIFDTSSNLVTIGQSLQAGSPSGGLTKLGSGVLTLVSFNSYTGNTVVANGTLAVAAAASSYPSGSPLVISNGATISMDISGGSTITMPAATLNGGNLTLNYGSLSGNPGSAAINNLSSSGITLSAAGSNVINLTGSGFTAGPVPLIAYSGAIGGSGFSAIHLGSLPVGLSGVLSNDTVHSMIVLQLSRVPNQLTWYGDKSANWDTNTANWNGGLATYNDGGGLGDIVTFDDSLNPGTSNTNINLVGTLSPLNVNLNNNSFPYRFGGSGKLGGIGTLVKNGTAPLTLTTANTFAGGSFLTNGTVYLGNDAGLGAGPVTMVGATLSSDGATARMVTNAVVFAVPQFTTTVGTFGDGASAGSITLSGPVNWSGTACTVIVSNNLIFSGVLSNGGLDVKNGSGTLTFAGATDAMTLGNLQIQDGSMVVSSGTLDRMHGGIRIAAFNSAAQQASCSISGGATVLLDGSGNNVLVGNNTGDPSMINVLDITGTLSCTTNNLNGTVQIGTNSALAQLNLRAGGLLRVSSILATGPNSELDFYGGTLAGTINQGAFMQGIGACNLRSGGVIVNTTGLTGQALSLTISQPLLYGGVTSGLTKTGSGTLILTGANNYTGTTTVSAGTLQFGGATAPQTGVISVADGATLAFTTTAGSTLPVGAVTLGSSTGAGLSLIVPGTGNPTVPIASVSTLTLNGPTAVNVSGTGLSNGLIQLVSYTSLSGSGTLTTGTLPAGVTATVTNNTSAKLIELNITLVTNIPPPPTFTIFDDTFEPTCSSNATRLDDDCDTNDIIWRPRVSTQASAYSIVSDPAPGMGSFALKFHNGVAGNNGGWILGQFDNDASDGVTMGSNSVPVSLGTNVNNALDFTIRVRVDQDIGTNGKSFSCGLVNIAGGPRSDDGTTDNSWIDTCTGYYFQINEAVAAQVKIGKQLGTSATTTPYGGAPAAPVLTNGITNGSGPVTAGFMLDTLPHAIEMKFTRVTAGSAGSVEIDVYWDGLLVSSVIDDGSVGTVAPYSQFNTIGIMYGSGGGVSGPGYYFDDAKLVSSVGTSSSIPKLSASLSGANVIITATGGPANAPVWLLMGTNVNQSVTNWTKINTNVLNGSGGLTITNPVNPAAPRQFYRLELQ